MSLDHEFINPLWNLADTLTVVQAAALIAEVEPNAIRFNVNGDVYFENEHGASDSTGGRSVKTAFEALKNAIYAGKLKTKLIYDIRPVDEGDTQNLVDMHEFGEYFNPGYEQLSEADEHYKDGYFIKNDVNWEKSFVSVDDLRAWLLSKGYRTGFFFPNESIEPNYFNKDNPYYAPKLAAAIRAWEAISTDEKLKDNGKSVKQNLINWLTAHAAEYSLIKDNGEINNNAIENQVSMVANWSDKGGASKTPTK